MTPQDVKNIENLLLNEFLTVETIIGLGYEKVKYLLHVGNHLHHTMHMIEGQQLFTKYRISPEKLQHDHEVLVNNMDKVEAGIRHFEKYSVLYFKERPLFIHAN